MAPLPDRLPVLVDLELQERDMLPFQVIDGLRRDEERSGHRYFPREERVGVVRVGVEVLPVPDEEVQLVAVAQLCYELVEQSEAVLRLKTAAELFPLLVDAVDEVEEHALGVSAAELRVLIVIDGCA